MTGRVVRACINFIFDLFVASKKEIGVRQRHGNADKFGKCE
jgi:hypothetical protein